MNTPHYAVKSSESRLHFEFFSEGPKGRILKVVDYSYIEEIGIWNLGFGDYESETGLVNDKAVSDNQDARKIIATVIFTLHEFFVAHPEATVFFTGSTDLRTAIYGRTISRNLDAFSNLYIIEGVNKDGSVEPFDRYKTYAAYLLSRCRI